MQGSANLNLMIKAARKAGRSLVKDFREGVEIYWRTEIAAMKERGEVIDKFTQSDMFDLSYAAAR